MRRDRDDGEEDVGKAAADVWEVGVYERFDDRGGAEWAADCEVYDQGEAPVGTYVSPSPELGFLVLGAGRQGL